MNHFTHLLFEELAEKIVDLFNSTTGDKKISLLNMIFDQTTKIINCKVAYLRPAYQNLKEWMETSGNVYIGRRGVLILDGRRFPEKDSIFANPFKIDAIHDRTAVIEQYRSYIIDRLQKEPDLVEELRKLKGKTLGCWCHPERCHGDVLIDLINQI